MSILFLAIPCSVCLSNLSVITVQPRAILFAFSAITVGRLISPSLWAPLTCDVLCSTVWGWSFKFSTIWGSDIKSSKNEGSFSISASNWSFKSSTVWDWLFKYSSSSWSFGFKTSSTRGQEVKPTGCVWFSNLGAWLPKFLTWF